MIGVDNYICYYSYQLQSPAAPNKMSQRHYIILCEEGCCACKGTGQTAQNEPCPDCKGTGVFQYPVDLRKALFELKVQYE